MTNTESGSTNRPRRAIVAFGDFEFDPENRLLSRGGEELPLPPRALGVLSFLLEEPGRVATKKELLEAVWSGAHVTDTSLSEAVRLLRQALGDDPQRSVYIQTVHRRGYRFIAPVRRADGDPHAAPAAVPESDPSLLPSVAAAPPPSSAARAERRRTVPWRTVAVVVAAALISAAAAVVVMRQRMPAPALPPVVRFVLQPAPPAELVHAVPSLAVSGDGRNLVYVTRRGTETMLVHRSLSTFAERPIGGSSGALAPFFSPDGRRVAFYVDDQLLAVPLEGGAPLPLAAVTGNFGGGSWAGDGSVVFSAGSPATLYRARQGGAIQRITTADARRGELYGHFWPHVVDDGRAVVFTSWSTTFADARVEWLSLDTGERRTLLRGASKCQVARGYLLCVREGGAIIAAPFDGRRGRLTGPPVPVLRDVAAYPWIGFAHFAVGGDTLIYLQGGEHETTRRLLRLDETGRAVPLDAAPRHYRNIRNGPHGRVAATILSGERSDVWIFEERSKSLSRLTFSGFNVQPVWSPDGRWVAFAASDGGTFNMYRQRSDGTGRAERLLTSARHQLPLAWSPDGQELMLRDTAESTTADLWVLHLPSRTVRPWARSRAREALAEWSPDGRWVAYTSDETGQPEVYVRGYPDDRGRWQVSSDGGDYPSWSADGRTVYFLRRHQLDPGAEIWAVPVEPAGDELNAGVARRIYSSPGLRFATAGPGGVLMIAETRHPVTPRELRVVLGWSSVAGAVRPRPR